MPGIFGLPMIKEKVGRLDIGSGIITILSEADGYQKQGF